VSECIHSFNYSLILYYISATLVHVKYTNRSKHNPYIKGDNILVWNAAKHVENDDVRGSRRTT
jgi:hypothetical protein